MGLKVEVLAKVSERSNGSGFTPPQNAAAVFPTQEDALTQLSVASMKGAGKVFRRITGDRYGLRTETSTQTVYAIPLDSDGAYDPNGAPITATELWETE